MILECPSCGTYYDTPAVIPPEGRKVRCAKCGNAWLAMPSPSDADEAPVEQELAEPEPDEGALAGQADPEPEESAAGEEPVEEQVPDEVVAGEEVADEAVAGEETEVEISVEVEEPKLAVEEAVAEALDEAAAEDAAVDALVEAALATEMAESGDAVEASPGSAEAALPENEPEPAEPVAEGDDRAPGDKETPEPADEVAEAEEEVQEPAFEAADAEAEAEMAAPADAGQEPEEEAPPPEADYPIGDFSHQGMGPARSPMQEILTSAADKGAAQPARDEAGGQAGAETEQSQPVEPVGSGETVVAVPAAEQEAPEIASPEADEAAPSSESDGDSAAPAMEAEPSAIEPEADVIVAGEAAIADQSAAAAQAAAGQDFQPSTRQLVSWAMLAVLVVAGFTLAIVNREAVVSSMPGTASFYSGLGLTVNLRGLDFENVTSTWTTEADQPVLEVNGEIVNITDGPIQVPSVVFELHDENGVEVHQWEAEVTKDPLGAGQRMDFSARISSPPASSRSVQVKFAGAR